ncbi:hypothetical protein [Porcincola intestinalis]|uniref:hypothetical protein n=1 Tax=Porcincola intestinalis TaxID=2606632 RepID=UPI002A7F3128|nr:hypothetical protein [Porcincola intestinalis]MDY4204504.1 hypothetical protein [Porcincola intestinalis]
MTDAEKKLERQQEKEEQREKRRQERQKIASLHGKKRLQYLWDYYKVWLVFLAIAIVAVNIAVTIVRGLMTKTLLQVSALSADYSATGDQMQKDFSSYIGGLKKHEELSFDLSIDLHPGAVTQAEQVADVKLQVQVSSGTLDVVLVPDYAFSYIQQRGMLMSLDDVLSPEEIETYGKAGDLAYASTPDLQALSEQDASEAGTLDPEGESTVRAVTALSSLQNQTEPGTEAAEAEAKTVAETATEIHSSPSSGEQMYGVRVDDSGVLSDYAWYPTGQKVYFGIVSNTRHEDMALTYLHYLKGADNK